MKVLPIVEEIHKRLVWEENEPPLTSHIEESDDSKEQGSLKDEIDLRNILGFLN